MARFTLTPLASATTSALAVMATLASLNASAQDAGPAQTITITGRTSARNAASVAGFGDVPLAQSPTSRERKKSRR